MAGPDPRSDLSEADEAKLADLRRRAHALDNYLSAIRLYTDLLRRELDRELAIEEIRVEVRAEIDEIRQAVDEAMRISRELFTELVPSAPRRD